VPDPIGMERVIMPDYGFRGTTSDYFVQAVDNDLCKARGEPGEFVLTVQKVAGEVDESLLCGPAFGRSVDNIAPADPGRITVAGNRVRWDLSLDDRLVATVTDWQGRGHEVYGVSEYAVYRDGACVGIVGRGVSSWTDGEHSGGQYQVFAFDGTNLSRGAVPVTVLPTRSALYQNYPNPFNPTTTIQYSVVSDQSPPHITLTIFNLLGQEVRTLVDEVAEPGYYTATWNGTDLFGNEAPSGVYFYRLTLGAASHENLGGVTKTRRMILLR